MKIPKLIENILVRLEKQEENLKMILLAKGNGWMSVKVASVLLRKSTDAIKQRIKHPTRPIKKDKVWAQDAKGGNISIHLGNFKACM